MAKIEVRNPTNHSVDAGEPTLLEPQEVRKVDQTEHVDELIAVGELAIVPKPEKKPANSNGGDQS